VLSTGHRMLSRADADLAASGGHGSSGDLDDVAGEVADEFGGAPAAIDSELQVEHGGRHSASARS
jgi:hypothetical protein